MTFPTHFTVESDGSKAKLIEIKYGKGIYSFNGVHLKNELVPISEKDMERSLRLKYFKTTQ